MLIAEDLLLLVTADDTGKLAAGSTNTDVALGGALLAELALAHRGDGVLDDALATVGDKEGKKPQSVVAALGKRTRVRLYERLAEGGLLRAEAGRILGVFPSHRWPAEDVGHEAAVRAGLSTALRDGVTTDARTRALISLLLALKAVHTAVAPESVGLSKRELDASAKRIAEGDWAAKAVRSAINSKDAAIYSAGAAGKGGF